MIGAATADTLLLDLAHVCVDYYVEPAELVTLAHGRIEAFSPDIQKRIRDAASSIVALDFRNDTEVTEKDIASLGLEFKQLRRLDLRGCTQLQGASWEAFQFVNLDGEEGGHKGFQMLYTAFSLHASLCIQVTDSQEFIFSHHDIIEAERRVEYVTTSTRVQHQISQFREPEFNATQLVPYKLSANATSAQESQEYSTIRAQQRDEALKKSEMLRALSVGKELPVLRRM